MTTKQQLELPILADVKGRQTSRVHDNKFSESAKQATTSMDGNFHKPASADDLSIYNSISASYFAPSPK